MFVRVHYFVSFPRDHDYGWGLIKGDSCNEQRLERLERIPPLFKLDKCSGSREILPRLK